MDCFWHGTASEQAALEILKCGIRPPPPGGKHWFAPIPGRVYLSQKPSYAIIYLIRADSAGHALPESLMSRWGRYGYLFCVERVTVTGDVQPDEDAVGEMLYYLKDDDERSRGFEWLRDLAYYTVAKSRILAAEYGEHVYWSSVGKQLLRRMSPWQKQALIDSGVAVSVAGTVCPAAAWKFDKRKVDQIEDDYSNFFELAERIL